MTTLKEWIKKKALSFLGLSQYDGTPGDDRLTFINDEDHIQNSKIREYNMWYAGDSDELLNFYTRQNTIDYNYEPWYNRNKKSYFWSVASTENDIKRTHSGQPRNIVDTLVAVIGKPDIQGGPHEMGPENVINENIDAIIRENKFWKIYEQQQMPLTLVEGWGCYKINWDLDLSDYPIILYYRAEAVDFIYKSNRLIGVIFKDFYTDGKNKKYLVTETRRLEKRNLYIDKEAFLLSGEDDTLTKVKIKDVPELAHLEEHLVIEGFNNLLAVPCVFYEDTHTPAPGRSIFTGKIDLFDDLDQCLSQAANTVRRSTAVEYFDSNFLDRDSKTGMLVAPKEFDRKLVMYRGSTGPDGTSQGSTPVQVTQPELNFEQYSTQAISILMQIVNGIMSPATLGIDISKRDNAEAQREKEKVTIFTRNLLVDTESDILKDLFSQVLCAYELMRTGTITHPHYDISINYSEFADDSFENKIAVLGDAYDKKNISPRMYATKLYGHSLSASDFQAELEFLEEASQNREENPFDEDEEDEEGTPVLPGNPLGVNPNEEAEQRPFN